MKDFYRFSSLSLISFSIAIIVYPLIHEFGHIISTAFLGGKIVNVSMFPIPNVYCSVGGINPNGMMLISISGIGLPWFLSLFLKFQRFTLWFGFLIFKLITVYSLLLSVIAIISQKTEYCIKNDDMLIFIQNYSGKSQNIIFILVLMNIILLLNICKQQPIRMLVHNL